jgi:drug/metabolite transporter (DMT)-like permease
LSTFHPDGADPARDAWTTEGAIEAALALGLASALAWGVSAYLGAVAARRVGAWLTNIGSALASLAVLLPVGLVAMPARPADATLADVLLLGAIGIGALLLDFVVYRLLTVAPVAIIYPIVASNGAVVTALAVIVLGEQLSATQLLGVLLVAVGIFAIAWPGRVGEPAIPGLADEELVAVSVLSDAAPPGPAAPARAPALAIFTAIGVTLLAGLLLFVVAESIKRLGWYQPIVIDRLAQGVLIVALLAVGFPRRRAAPSDGRGWWAVIVAVGVLNATAAALYAFGNQIGSTAVTATAASTFAAVPVVLGIVLLGERPQPHQLAGIVAALAGIVALGAG